MDKSFQTKTYENDNNPVWNEVFEIFITSISDDIRFEVIETGKADDKIIG